MAKNCSIYTVSRLNSEGNSQHPPKTVKICPHQTSNKNNSYPNPNQNSQTLTSTKQTGGNNRNHVPKPSNEFVLINGKQKRVYIGKRGGCYIKLIDKLKGEFVYKRIKKQ